MTTIDRPSALMTPNSHGATRIRGSAGADKPWFEDSTSHVHDRPAASDAVGAGEISVLVQAVPVPSCYEDRHLEHEALGSGPAVPPGRGVAGTVVAVGSGVTAFRPGDEVLGPVKAGHCGFAHYTVLTADTTTWKPRNVSSVNAAALSDTGIRAYAAMSQLGLRPGQTLLILGVTHDIGTIVAQLAHNQRISVLGTGRESRRSLVESDGATFLPDLHDVAHALGESGSYAINGVLDLAGGSMLAQARQLVGDRTRLVSVAAQPVAARARTETAGQAETRTHNRHELTKLVAEVEADRLDPHVNDVYYIDQLDEAIAASRSGTARGSVVVVLTGHAQLPMSYTCHCNSIAGTLADTDRLIS